MILYDLKCDKGHVFEAWFHSSAAYDRQVADGEVACAVCGSAKIEKAPMAPRLSRGRSGEKQAESGQSVQSAGTAASLPDAEAAGELRRKLKELRRHVEANCEYVGSAFPEEARKIHYGETSPRGIYGETSDDEAKKMKDEGLPVARIPWLRKDDA
ncbi:MAG: DUF1178 family protein [Rhodovibrionaceae bacterium]|nr:DUF1178 family protein [Rhodovibrionaceae bacterium]